MRTLQIDALIERSDGEEIDEQLLHEIMSKIIGAVEECDCIIWSFWKGIKDGGNNEKGGEKP